jgi:hypothetical protein
VVFIGLINFTASLIYDAMQYFPLSLTTTLFGTITWFLSQGMNAIIYLIINRSIRKIILKKVGLHRGQTSQVSASNPQQFLRNSTTDNTNQ